MPQRVDVHVSKQWLAHLFCRLLSVCLLSVLCIACEDSYRVHIGVSQSSDDGWRRKANREMQAAKFLHENMDLTIYTADNDAQKQVRQVNELIDQGIDLLIVSPIDTLTVVPAVERAYSKGIPVILFDRRLHTKRYTAYIGSDNAQIGKIMGVYVAAHLLGKGKIVELTGDMESSPAQERHEGFMSVMRNYPEVQVTMLKGDWYRDRAYQLMGAYLDTHEVPDVVFGHNDAEAQGAYKAAYERGVAKQICFVGIDGLPGVDEGLDYVAKGILSASCIYPTSGDAVIHMAMEILNNAPFQREHILPTTLVTKENVQLVLGQHEELHRRYSDLEQIYLQTQNYHKLYQNQKLMSVLFFVGILLLVLLLVGIIRTAKAKDRLNKKIQEIADYRLKFLIGVSHRLRTPLTLITGPIAHLLKDSKLKGEDRKLLEMTERNVASLARLVENVLSYKEAHPDRELPDFLSDGEETGDALRVGNTQQRVRLIAEEKREELPSVLVVDDNADVRAYLQMVLADRYYVMESSDGEAGLAVAKAQVPDIVVSDVMMPVMDGLQFCSRLKEDPVTSHIPVILLTARSMESQRIEGYEHGADAYITKPFSMELLVSRIENLLRNRHHLKQLFTAPVDTNVAREGMQVALEAENVHVSERDKEFISMVRKVIHENMSNPKLRMDDISDQIGLSRVQMYRKVKALTGLTPVELLRTVRLEKARHLLRTTNEPISQVAYAVGFATPSYFTTCFKQEFGMYPADCRENR